MEYKKIMFMLVLAVFLLSITCVSASEIDDTLASEDTNTIGLSVDNDIIEDNLQTSEENDELALTDNDETLSAKNDTDVLSDNSGTYSGLSAEIGFGGNIELQHDYYTYDTGNTISISVADSVIDGKGATINMTGSNIRAFTVSASGVTIKNLTIINANYDDHGGAIYFSSSGTVSNCNFADNKATGDYSYGGAVYFLNVGEVSNCNFAGNTATHYGGAVYFSNTSSVSNCNFTANTATYEGGAVYFQNTGTVSNCNFTNNKATDTNGRGGAIYFDQSCAVENCNFINNIADNYGGAIWFRGTFNVTNCNFTNNFAGNAGAVYGSSTGTVENCNFTNNTANIWGGAVCFDYGSTSTFVNCNFANNQANGDISHGGAIYFGGSGNVTNCNFINNTAMYCDGCAIYMHSGTVTNSRFINNVGDYGAILSFNWGTVTADTCIFKTDSDSTYKVNILPPTLNVDNFTDVFNSGRKLTFDLKTNSSMPVDNGNISINIYYKNNGSWVGNYSCLSGKGWTVDLPAGSYYAVFNTEYAGFKPVNRTIIINKVKTELTAKAITATYNSNKKMVITLTDINGKPLNGVKLTVKIKSDKTYTTDKNGQVKISVGKLTPKTYNVKITFGENANYLSSSANVKVTVKKAKSKITTKKKTIKKAKKYAITLKSGKTPIKKVKVILKIKKKTFKAKTNKKGKATFKIKKLKKGTYTAKVTFKGNKYYKKSTKKVKIKIK